MKRLFALPLLLLVCACDPDPKPVDAAPPPTPLAQAKALAKQKDYPGAIAVLEAARQAGGEEPAVVKGLVELYMAQGDEARAIVRAKAGLAAHPDANDLYLPLANLYIGIKDIDSALPVLTEARKRGIEDANVSMSIGTCLAFKEDTAGARTEFERAQKAGADDEKVTMNLALLLLQENKSDQALPAFEAISAKYPKNAGAKREIARLLLAQAGAKAKDGAPLDKAAVDRAMNLLWDVKDELANDWRMHEAMGDGWLLIGDLDASVAAYTQALKLGRNPKSVEERYKVAKKLQNDAARAAGETKPPAK